MDKKLKNIFVLAILNAIFLTTGVSLLFILLIFILASIPQIQANPISYQDAYIAVVVVLAVLGGAFCLVAVILNLTGSIFILVTDFNNPTVNSDSVRLLWGLLSLLFIGFLGQLIFIAKARSLLSDTKQVTPTTVE